MCLICSQNKTLQLLALSDNVVGDAGAAAIGDALMYIANNFFFFFFLYENARGLSMSGQHRALKFIYIYIYIYTL